MVWSGRPFHLPTKPLVGLGLMPGDLGRSFWASLCVQTVAGLFSPSLPTRPVALKTELQTTSVEVVS